MIRSATGEYQRVILHIHGDCVQGVFIIGNDAGGNFILNVRGNIPAQIARAEALVVTLFGYETACGIGK